MKDIKKLLATVLSLCMFFSSIYLVQSFSLEDQCSLPVCNADYSNFRFEVQDSLPVCNANEFDFNFESLVRNFFGVPTSSPKYNTNDCGLVPITIVGASLGYFIAKVIHQNSFKSKTFRQKAQKSLKNKKF